MKNWTPLTWTLFLLGEAILIAGFCLFGHRLPDNVYYLDLIISSVIYILLFLNFARPMVRLDDESGSDVGSLGISWTFTGWYAVLSVICMIAMPYCDLEFKYQLIAQAILLFFLLMGIIFSRESGSKVAEVYHREKSMTDGMDNVRRQMRAVLDTLAETRNVPAPVRQRIDRINESLRYISPSDNPEAEGLETLMAESLADINRALADVELNRSLIDSRLSRTERCCENRKKLFSR
ncbi:MAG: hypothetical protein K2I38_06860 [Duncaniella sp.]|nr:hypothetical protein [Duncaniella sp.]